MSAQIKYRPFRCTILSWELISKKLEVAPNKFVDEKYEVYLTLTSRQVVGHRTIFTGKMSGLWEGCMLFVRGELNHEMGDGNIWADRLPRVS